MFTASDVMKSERFMEITVKEAIEYLANKNNASALEYEMMYRSRVGASKLVKDVDALVLAAAEETAKRLNSQ